LCKTKRGFSTGEFYYGRFSNNISPDGLAALRQGFADLLAGTRTQFTTRYETAASGGNRFTYEDTWRRIGIETITIAGQPIAAVAFERAQQNLGAIFQGTEKLWYDPSSGVWVKRTKTAGGETSQNFAIDWEVSKISVP